MIATLFPPPQHAGRALRAELAVFRDVVPAYERAVLGALQSKSMYEGTVPHAVRDKRRKQNRVARQSRKINRSR